MIRQDLHYAIRSIVTRPGFAVVVVVSLALGIGANTALVSVWNSILRASLPGIARPHELVMLTNPTASGSWRGTWTTKTDGPRNWLTYPEFEQIRERASVFAVLMAAQGSMDIWQIRVDAGTTEPVRARLVSSGFFDVLGVRPALGRFLLRTKTRAKRPPV